MREANMAAAFCSQRSSVASFGPLLILMVLGTGVWMRHKSEKVKTERESALNNFFSSSLSGLATGGAQLELANQNGIGFVMGGEN
jgi:hypothetical protein